MSLVEAKPVENVVDVKSKAKSTNDAEIDDITSAFSDLTVIDDYNGMEIPNISSADLKRLHGMISSAVCVDSDGTCTSIMLSKMRVLDVSMYRIKTDGAVGAWVDSNGDVASEINPIVKKKISAEDKLGNIITFVYSGDFNPKDDKPNKKTKQLINHDKSKTIRCHAFNKKTKKYTFVGNLKLLSVDTVAIKVGDQTVDQSVFYFV